MIQSYEDIGKVAQVTAFVIAKALELSMIVLIPINVFRSSHQSLPRYCRHSRLVAFDRHILVSMSNSLCLSLSCHNILGFTIVDVAMFTSI